MSREIHGSHKERLRKSVLGYFFYTVQSKSFIHFVMLFRNQKVSFFFFFFLSRYLVWKVRWEVQEVRVVQVGLEVPDEDGGKVQDWTQGPEDQVDREVHHGRWYQEFLVVQGLQYRLWVLAILRGIH